MMCEARAGCWATVSKKTWAVDRRSVEPVGSGHAYLSPGLSRRTCAASVLGLLPSKKEKPEGATAPLRGWHVEAISEPMKKQPNQAPEPTAGLRPAAAHL